ncbi:MAG: hypothetical protein IH627_02245, partial [Rubrivivax sp.]|nr:hypothetical protein [Rubrivivax sp.]
MTETERHSSALGAKVAAAGAHGLPRPWLVADIGGTNARFAILVDSYAEP